MLKEGFQTITVPKSGTYSFEVIGPGMSFKDHKNEECGARISGKIRLEQGEKITVALGQRCEGTYVSGSGATYVVKQNENRTEPLFIAAGAGHSTTEYIFGRASLTQTANGNEKIGSSGVQKFQDGEKEDFFCAGAGFLEAPKVEKLHDLSEPPKSFSEGLIGGKGYDFEDACALEGGFGGGGASFHRRLNGKLICYIGGGGGYTCGSTEIRDDENCDGGGGGSYAADPNAKFDHKFEEYGKCKIKFLN